MREDASVDNYILYYKRRFDAFKYCDEIGLYDDEKRREKPGHYCEGLTMGDKAYYDARKELGFNASELRVNLYAIELIKNLDMPESLKGIAINELDPTEVLTTGYTNNLREENRQFKRVSLYHELDRELSKAGVENNKKITNHIRSLDYFYQDRIEKCREVICKYKEKKRLARVDYCDCKLTYQEFDKIRIKYFWKIEKLNEMISRLKRMIKENENYRC